MKQAKNNASAATVLARVKLHTALIGSSLVTSWCILTHFLRDLEALEYGHHFKLEHDLRRAIVWKIEEDGSQAMLMYDFS